MRVYRLGREFRTLPYPGGLLDQPNTAMRRLEIVLDVMSDLENEEMKASEARNKVRQR